MSRRHFLNISMGSTAFLLLIAIGAILTNLGSRDGNGVQIALSEQQVQLVDDLNRQAGELANAADFPSVLKARKDLAASILRFDSTLSALLHGGALKDPDGTRIECTAVKSGPALEALQAGVTLWSEIGLPLADLAAGEFSIFSAAGQQAIEGLRSGNVELAQNMALAREALAANAESGSGLAGGAIGVALVLGGLLAFLGYVRLRSNNQTSGRDGQSTPRSPFADSRSAAAATGSGAPAEEPVRGPIFAGSSNHSGAGFEGFTSPVDFDNVNASVDQMSVDMNTIAGSTDKMRMAIDSVGHALQGMLYSLNEMAQDTAEGYKVVRGANNAASYTASAAVELTSSAREMSQVVARVTQLALKTKQVASQIDAEAIHTGKTGEAFTSVVASEVKGLAVQTSQATSDIERTVAEILATARQYEEAIGQIIKNIASINKVSQNLGELMLHPPQTVVPGTPLVQAVAQPAPLGVPAAAQAAPAAAVPPQPEPEGTAPVVQTAAADPEAAPEAPVETAEEAPGEEESAAAEPESAPETEAEPAEPVDPWGGIIDDPVEPAPTADEVAEETSAAIQESADIPEEPAPTGSTGNVFMLGGGAKKKRPLPAAPAPEPVVEAADPEPEPVVETEPESTGDFATNIFMLQTPKKAGEPIIETEPEPDPVAAADPEEDDDEDDEDLVIGGPAPEAVEEKKSSNGNIFMLNKKK